MGGDTQVYHSHRKKYLLIFLLLGILTAIELAAAEWSNYTGKVISLSVLALAKAFAVAYWYMHLEDEKAWLKFIAAIPMSAFVYAVVVILESVNRQENFMEQRPSSIVDKSVQFPKADQMTASTWYVIIPFLICAMVVLKTFIYIKDKKRHGKQINSF